MIIKKLTLNNFMCYYDINSFEFSNGLNIILGHNGDGKSTIFTAFNWIFNPIFHLSLPDVFSQMKYVNILDGESFEVRVECVVEQYGEEYKISKFFTVSKKSNNSTLSSVKEEILRKNIVSGEVHTVNRSISDLSRQVFPEAFRNFSMFETETDALKIIEGKQLAELVKSFSFAKHYEKLDEVISNFAIRADKQFRRESNADASAQASIDEIDNDIKLTDEKITKLTNRISEDENGRDFYTEKINELVKNLTISEEYRKIDDQIEKLNKEIENARAEIRNRNRFTVFLFDNFNILKGFEDIMTKFSEKVDELRIQKNIVDNEERNKYAIEKLELENGSTPFPPGFPSLEILNEILRDKICKICDTPLNEKAEEYINKSIKIYEDSKKNEKELKTPIIFPNNFIDEFQILDRSFKIRPEKYSKERIIDEIKFDLKRIDDNNKIIRDNTKLVEDLDAKKVELLANTHSISENDLKNIQLNHETYSTEKSNLEIKIGENKVRLEQKQKDLEELHTKRNRTLAQFKDSNFKKSTVLLLQDFSTLAKDVKEKEYDKFLKILSDRATTYLKQINIGEITGRIELYKKNDEVKYKSINEDGSLRSTLSDSGALQISKPLSILFAIADIAAETMDNESYPMIFDAPTGRFSPDREQEFFRVLKSSKKQRIVVTLKFLDVDENHIPFIKKNEFENIVKDKAFFIKRDRPLQEDRPETINTEIEVCYPK